MPRANRRRRVDPELDVSRAIGGTARREVHRDGDWFVRQLTGAASAKDYRCPGCDHEVRSGHPHVVAWPADGPRSDSAALDDRRHWHTPCWAARARRGRR